MDQTKSDPDPTMVAPGTALPFLQGGGEMGALMRAKDWAKTPLGPMESWSTSLRTMTSILLANRFPMLLWWGPDSISIYNDAYIPVLGVKHPGALGLPVRECWSEIYDVLRPLILKPLNGGPPTWSEDLLLEVRRHGFLEETHWTIAYSPVPDEAAPNGIGGVLATVHEITAKIVGERRLKILRTLGARCPAAKNAEEACAIAAEVVGDHPEDVPFFMVYLADEDGRAARLAAAAGIEMGGPVSPLVVDLSDADGKTSWPLGRVLRKKRAELVEDLGSLSAASLRGYWRTPAERALVLPVPSTQAHRPAGVVVAGVSPRLALDALYQSFFELATAQLSTAIASARDYEEEHRRAEALAELDRAKTTFFSNISHEFRTPLTLMLGSLEDGFQDAQDPLTPGQRERATTAHRSGLRLLKMVNTLLDFSRIEAGRARASYEPTDVAKLTADVASTFRSLVERAGLRLTLDCPPMAEPVFVDRQMWEKIVLNLVSNAFKFTSEGSILVRVEQDEQSARLIVRDTGTGIDAMHLPHLFERFYRVEGARGRTYEGSGIGLALVRELAKLHGGSASVESESGKGATFTVTVPKGSAHLPKDRIQAARALGYTALGAASFIQEATGWFDAKAPGAEPAVGEQPRCEAPGSARLLVADDNADMRAYLQRLLRPLGTVEAVGDGAQALAAIRRRVPDLILSDVMMPDLDGFGLVRVLRKDERTRTLPIVLLSARAGEEARVEGMDTGADEYIVKPFSARELIARVRSQLQLARLRREHAQTLRESEDRFRALVMASSDAVYRMSPDWSEMRFLRGHDFIPDTEEPSQTWLRKYIHPDDQKRVLEVIHEAIRTKSVFELEHRVLRVDGTLGWTFSRAIPLRDQEGEIVEWFGAASDITERKRAEEALRDANLELAEADRRKNEFMAMLSHELRNPLAPIRNSLYILDRAAPGGDQARRAKAVMDRQIDQLVHLVDDLLDVTRITRGKIHLQRERLELNELVRRAIDDQRSLFERAGIQLDFQPALPAPVFVDADWARLAQMVDNLLQNAAKFTNRGGRVSVSIASEREARRAVIRVVDNGIGISPQTLARLFQPFVQADSSLDRSIGGLGLGLALVKGLVELHGGTVRAESDGLGKGAQFVMELPLAAALEASSRPERPGRSARRRRVLVIEDNVDAADSLREALALDDHEVEVANDGPEGLVKARRFRPEVVLCDIGLPGMDGFEVARAFRMDETLKNVSLVALTGYALGADLERAAKAGFQRHLAKPASLEALQVLLSELPSETGPEEPRAAREA